MTTSPVDRTQLAQSAAKLLQETWQHSAAVVAVAPGRVNIIGEHTDYAGGMCLPFALPHATATALTPRSDKVIRVHSRLPDGETFTYEGAMDEAADAALTQGQWWSYIFGIFWVVKQAGYDISGADIAITSDVPLGAGVSSSAALGCSVALAVREAFGLTDALDRRALVDLCVRSENTVVGAATGGLDQRVSLQAQSGHALLLDFGTDATEQIPADLAGHDATWLIIDTGRAHALHDGGYGQRRRWCTEAADFLNIPHLSAAADLPTAELAEKLVLLGRSDALNATRHVLSENSRVHSVAEDLRTRSDGFTQRIGTHLTASHDSLASEMGVSTDELDLAVVTARDAGAHGARLIGGGFGGSIVALAPADRAENILRDVQIIFAERGLGVPTGFVATPSAGATVWSGAELREAADVATTVGETAPH